MTEKVIVPIGNLREGALFSYKDRTYKVLGIAKKTQIFITPSNWIDIPYIRCKNVENEKEEIFRFDTYIWTGNG